ncbi:MEMO1 family protein [Thermogladius sp. 4427co]|uniref:MEMO1 family protein n=1 Tax=Thermogladius sp. 4427co TaxID=3450718 RepID=UPI003F794B6D
MSKRYPAVAGYFYPRDRKELVSTIQQAFLHRLGPGKLPTIGGFRDKSVIGYVVPHAGYVYSGPVAAHSYYDLASSGIPETIVVLGTNHTGYGALVSVYPKGSWVTPLGEVEVDSELASKVVDISSYAELDEDAHIEEHSIEVQIPFLQYIYGDRFKILPVTIGLHTVEVARDLALSLLKASSELKRDIVVLASSDFNHYEPQDITVSKDMEAINYIIRGDVEGFYRVLIEKNITVCGPGGIMTLIEYAKQVSGGKWKAVLLKHATSGDITGDYYAVVGYASIKFQRE